MTGLACFGHACVPGVISALGVGRMPVPVRGLKGGMMKGLGLKAGRGTGAGWNSACVRNMLALIVLVACLLNCAGVVSVRKLVEVSIACPLAKA